MFGSWLAKCDISPCTMKSACPTASVAWIIRPSVHTRSKRTVAPYACLQNAISASVSTQVSIGIIKGPPEQAG